MKSYIIKIELQHSKPLIWRRVVMPAGATYRRLHDVIQNVTNFMSGYPFGGYHLYQFDLNYENRLVTDDEEALAQHQHYLKNKAMFEERLATMEPQYQRFEAAYQERLKKDIRKPTGLKIDSYLEKYSPLNYLYDFGDSWEFLITLEKVVDDYYFGYPTLLGGANDAPPEDVGGMGGFQEYLAAYNNPNHPEHESTVIWGNSTKFRRFDIDELNDQLKAISYKKTEWDQINHDHYRIISDKYRKSDI